MDYQNFLLDAIEVVLGWDIHDEDGFIQAVKSQACLMALMSPEEITAD